MIKCPVCGKYEFKGENDYDVCPVCGWENDVVQLEDPDYDGGANDISLNEARRRWAEGTLAWGIHRDELERKKMKNEQR